MWMVWKKQKWLRNKTWAGNNLGSLPGEWFLTFCFSMIMYFTFYCLAETYTQAKLTFLSSDFLISCFFLGGLSLLPQLLRKYAIGWSQTEKEQVRPGFIFCFLYYFCNGKKTHGTNSFHFFTSPLPQINCPLNKLSILEQFWIKNYCVDDTENSLLPHTQCPLLLTSYIRMVYLSQLLNNTGTLLLNTLHILFRFA